jgi:hypothetical protein
MKGLEELIEEHENVIEFQKRVVLHVSAIVISSVLLVDEINFFLNRNKKNKNHENL